MKWIFFVILSREQFRSELYSHVGSYERRIEAREGGSKKKPGKKIIIIIIIKIIDLALIGRP
jgi:hypothetical protein